MPSLWYEGFGLTVMEAMLHGIPVISSDAGGLVEAKMGTPFVAPAPAIERYAPVFDEHSLPQPVIGPLDLRPWEQALRALLDRSRAIRAGFGGLSREAALRFADSLDAGRMPEFLHVAQAGRSAAGTRHSLANLSPEKRTLLLQHGSQPEALNAHPAGAKRALLSGVWRRRPLQSSADGSAGRARSRLPRGGAHRRVLASTGTRNICAIWRRAGFRRWPRKTASSCSAALESRHTWSRYHPNLRAYFAAQIAAFATGRDPDFYGRSRATAAGGRRAVARAHGLPGARHAGVAVWSGLRLPQRGQNGGAAAGRMP